MRIEKNLSGAIEFGKRVYLRGYHAFDDCAKCDNELEVDLGDRCLSYPCNDSVQKVWFFCEDCHHEWSVPFEFSIQLTPLDK